MLGKPTVIKASDGEVVRLSVTSSTEIQSANLYYTSDTGPRSGRQWQSMAAKFENGSVIVPLPPKSANTWFIAVTDQRDAMVSSSVQFSKP